MLHRFTALASILGLVHSLGEGTDAGRPWLLATVAIACGPPLVLLAARVARRSAPPRAQQRLVGAVDKRPA